MTMDGDDHVWSENLLPKGVIGMMCFAQMAFLTTRRSHLPTQASLLFR